MAVPLIAGQARLAVPIALALLTAGGACNSPLAAPPAVAAPIAITIYGDDGYPPYSFEEHGELKGLYPRIIRQALDKMPEYRVQLLPIPWKRGLLKLETGEAFALFPPYLRPDERPYVSYSDAILEEQVVVFCNQIVLSKGTLLAWPADYTGLRIGINAGFLSGGKPFEQAVKQGKLSEVPARSSRNNLLKLLMGRIDCYLNDRLAIVWELARLRHEKLVDTQALAVGETARLGAEQAYLGYTTRAPERYPYRRDFIKRFNEVLRGMKQDGEIRATVEQFLRLPE